MCTTSAVLRSRCFSGKYFPSLLAYPFKTTKEKRQQETWKSEKAKTSEIDGEMGEGGGGAEKKTFFKAIHSRAVKYEMPLPKFSVFFFDYAETFLSRCEKFVNLPTRINIIIKCEGECVQRLALIPYK